MENKFITLHKMSINENTENTENNEKTEDKKEETKLISKLKKSILTIKTPKELKIDPNFFSLTPKKDEENNTPNSESNYINKLVTNKPIQRFVNSLFSKVSPIKTQQNEEDNKYQQLNTTGITSSEPNNNNNSSIINELKLMSPSKRSSVLRMKTSILNLIKKEVDNLKDESIINTQQEVFEKSHSLIMNTDSLSYEKSKKIKYEMETISNFLKKVDEEQNILMWQNLNLTKKKFNFGALNPKVIKMEKDFSKINFLSFNNKDKDPITKFIDILNANSIDFTNDKMFTGQFYRSFLMEKMTNENHLRKELMSLSKLVLESKKKKEKLIEEKSDNLRKLGRTKENFNMNKMKVECETKKLQNIFQEAIYTQNMIYSSIHHNLNPNNANNNQSDAEFKLTNEFMRLRALKENELLKINNHYEIKIQKLKNEIQIGDIKIFQVSKFLKNVNEQLNNKMNETKQYFLEILKKGIDVRLDGLSWCIKKLLEMNCYLDYSHFPRFLENSQIDFLVKLSQRQVELHYLNLVLKAIKVQPKNILEMDMKNESKFMKTDENLNGSFNFSYKTFFTTKTVNILEQVLSKFKNLINEGTLERNSEDLETQMIINYLKNKIKGQITENSPISSSPVKSSAKLKNLDRKDHLKEILLLRQVMKENHEEIVNLKKTELNKFSRKFDTKKLSNTKQSVMYDMVKAALFGNGISI